MTITSKRTEIKIRTEIVNTGDWNRGNGARVIGKPIGKVFIDGLGFPEDFHLVFSHNDLLKIIEVYLLADYLSIDLINQGKSGSVKRAEESFENKILKLFSHCQYQMKIIRKQD